MADNKIRTRIVKTISGVLKDIKDVAFTADYNDLLNTPTIPPATAVKGNAETTYRTGNVNLTPANIGAVNKSGDTMSGPLTHNGAGAVLKNTNLDVNGDNPTSNKWSNAPIEYRDKDNARIAFVNVQRRTDGSTVLEIGAQARNTADTADIYNTIDMIVGRDGARSYAVTNPAAFRTAIGLGNVNNTSDANKPISTATQAALDDIQDQVDYNTNSGVKNLLSTEWFATDPVVPQQGTVESYDVKTGSVTGFASASLTGNYLGINIAVDKMNNVLENGKTYILSWTVDSIETNIGIFGMRRNDNNSYSVGGSLTINKTGNYSVSYTHNSAIPVYFSLCLNTAGTSTDKRIAISNLMLREATIEDDTFVPYAKSNAELTSLTSGKLDATGMAYYKSYPEEFKVRAQKGSMYYELELDSTNGGVASLSHSSGSRICLSGGTPILWNSGRDMLLFKPDGCISSQPANSGSRFGLRIDSSGTYIGFFTGVPGVYDSDDIPMCTFTTAGIKMDNALISGRSGTPTLTTNTGTVYEFKDDGIYLNGTRIAP